MYGVCTSLGLGVQGLNEGVHRLNSNIGVNQDNQVIIIWLVTAGKEGENDKVTIQQ